MGYSIRPITRTDHPAAVCMPTARIVCASGGIPSAAPGERRAWIAPPTAPGRAVSGRLPDSRSPLGILPLDSPGRLAPQSTPTLTQ